MYFQCLEYLGYITLVQGLFFVTEEDVFQQKSEVKVIDCLQKLKASMKMTEPVFWPVFHIKRKSTQVKGQ